MIAMNTVNELARRHLPPEQARRLADFLEPEGRILTRDRSPGSRAPSGGWPGSPVAVLGGDPLLPVGTPWPTWEGHGPLSFVASLDCAALAEAVPIPVPTLPLPGDGVLLFFYFDGRADDYDVCVTPSLPETRPGARIVHVPAGAPVERVPTPAPLEPYPAVPLGAVAAVQRPRLTDPEVYEALGIDHRTARTDPACVAFAEALDRVPWSWHQVGGEPRPVQGEVEYEVGDFPEEWNLAQFNPDNPHFDDILAEADRWKLLLQVDSDDDADMMWGDGGSLYWMMTAEDAAEGRWDLARFTWQCG